MIGTGNEMKFESSSISGDPHDRNRYTDKLPLVNDMAAVKAAKSELRKAIHQKLKQLVQKDVSMQCVLVYVSL